jgi:hypothetical protein
VEVQIELQCLAAPARRDERADQLFVQPFVARVRLRERPQLVDQVTVAVQPRVRPDASDQAAEDTQVDEKCHRVLQDVRPV